MTKAGTWHRTAPVDAVSDGQMVGWEIGDHRVALYHIGDAFYATANICTHAFAILSDGWLEGDTVECPLHGGRFDVPTGKAAGDPVECDLQTYPVRVEDDFLLVLIPNAETSTG